jgi:heme exporter protein C
MLWPLSLMALAFTAFFVTVLILRVRSEIAAAKIRNLQLSLAQG